MSNSARLTSSLLFALTVSSVMASPPKAVSLTVASPTSTSLMAVANAKAMKEHKNVLVIFHASWCGWCHRLDDMLTSKEVGPTMSKAYVIVHLVVDENGPKKVDENPGADDLRKTLGGEKVGLPFFAVMTPDGKNLGTSIAPKVGNIGYPAQPSEVSYFMGLMKFTTPTLKDADRQAVESYLTNYAIKNKLNAQSGGH